MSESQQKFYDKAIKRGIQLVYKYKSDFPDERNRYYTVDFAVPDKKIAIDIDERYYDISEEEQNEEYRKNANFILNGWILVRIVGPEIYCDLDKSIDDIASIIKYYDIRRANLLMHERAKVELSSR